MKTINALFKTRRAADLAVEHLVQEHGIPRADLFLQAAGSDNTAGEEVGGADLASSEPGTDQRTDSSLHGPVELSIDLDDDRVDAVCTTLSETGGFSVATR